MLALGSESSAGSRVRDPYLQMPAALQQLSPIRIGAAATGELITDDVPAIKRKHSPLKLQEVRRIDDGIALGSEASTMP